MILIGNPSSDPAPLLLAANTVATRCDQLLASLRSPRATEPLSVCATAAFGAGGALRVHLLVSLPASPAVPVASLDVEGADVDELFGEADVDEVLTQLLRWL